MKSSNIMGITPGKILSLVPYHYFQYNSGILIDVLNFVHAYIDSDHQTLFEIKNLKTFTVLDITTACSQFNSAMGTMTYDSIAGVFTYTPA